MNNNKLISKSFRSEKNNVLTEDVNKMESSANNNERIQLIDSMETYEYKTNEKVTHRQTSSNIQNNTTKD